MIILSPRIPLQPVMSLVLKSVGKAHFAVDLTYGTAIARADGRAFDEGPDEAQLRK